MAFDFGFDYRSTAPYVTDPSYASPVLGELYPHTFTNGDGLSINAGWINSRDGITVANKNASVDARIAGHNFPDYGGNGHATWRIDLSSGSAPGAGTYAIGMAAGSVGSGSNTQQYHILLDNTTQLFTYGPTAITNQCVVDTTGTEYSAANWPGSNTAVNYAFASTTVNLELYVGFPSYWSMLAHFRLTLQAGGAPYTLTADTGTLSMSGKAATPRAARRLTGAKGTLAMTGRTAGVQASRRLSGGQGTLTLTGAAATKGLARRLTAATGTFSLTGIASLPSMLRRLAATTGSLVLTGRNATIRYTVPGTSTYHDRRDTTQPFRRHYS